MICVDFDRAAYRIAPLEQVNGREAELAHDRQTPVEAGLDFGAAVHLGVGIMRIEQPRVLGETGQGRLLVPGLERTKQTLQHGRCRFRHRVHPALVRKTTRCATYHNGRVRQHGPLQLDRATAIHHSAPPVPPDSE
jgi:hypothetical protein